MNSSRTATLCVLVGLLCLTWTLSADPPSAATNEPADEKTATSDQKQAAAKELTVAEARERAKLMHQVYAATLEVMHHHFFKRDRAVLPARALEDVFAEMDKSSKIKAAWIAVNTKAMSIQHEPKSDFDKQAAEAIAAGKGEFERVENGVYRRAGAIPLGASCVSCHTGFFSKTPQTQRFAGLVISVPLTNK
jgi:uncharacterized protein DUF3365